MKIQHLNARHQTVPIRIECDEQVYQPGSLTGALCDVMEVKPGARVIDVGCGSGYLGIFASLLGAGEVIGIDPVPQALDWTRHNARLNDIDNLVTICGHALEPVLSNEADLIITLPPQMPFAVNFNSWRYGGPDGTDVILEIIRKASKILKPRNGSLYLAHAALANPGKVRRALAGAGFVWKIVKTVTKEFNPADLNVLAAGLSDYILSLRDHDLADIIEGSSGSFYPVWFYRAALKD